MMQLWLGTIVNLVKENSILSCYDRNENKTVSIINRNIIIDSLMPFFKYLQA